MDEWQESEGRIERSEFEAFVVESERPVRYALCARFGFENGRDAAAEAFAYAWEHWDRISQMENPAGYVYRVGYRVGRKTQGRFEPVESSPAYVGMPAVEPKLASELSRLTPRQRTVVVLVLGLEWTHKETGEFLGLSTSTVQKHVERGVEKLRRGLGVDLEH